MTVAIEFCGERYELDQSSWFSIGRGGDLVVDDNPYLHRRFLEVGFADGLWWIVNVGDQLSATVADQGGSVQAWLAPGARLPLVFGHTTVRFTAGPMAYEVEVVQDRAPFDAPSRPSEHAGDTTISLRPLTVDQKRLVVALAEPVLRHEGRGGANVPSSADAARRLGWTLTRFNRKLDNVCQKLAKIGVQGLHGGPGVLASGRRARLVEYAVAVRLVTAEDLILLDQPDDGSDDPDA